MQTPGEDAKLIEINPKPTKLSSICDVVVRATAGETVPALLGSIEKMLTATSSNARPASVSTSSHHALSTSHSQPDHRFEQRSFNDLIDRVASSSISPSALSGPYHTRPPHNTLSTTINPRGANNSNVFS